MPKLGQKDLFLGDIFTFNTCQVQKSSTKQINVFVCCSTFYICIYEHLFWKLIKVFLQILSLMLFLANFSLYSKCQISLEILHANACLPVLGNLLYLDFPVFMLKQCNAKVHVRASMECNKLQSAKLKKKKKTGKEKNIIFIREHRMLQAEIFQKQMYSTKNVQTWENE